MKTLPYLFLALSFCTLADSNQAIIGRVYDTKTYKPLYQEYHQYSSLSHTVNYQVEGQLPFATKSLQSSNTTITRPTTRFSNQRCSESYDIDRLKENKDSDLLSISYNNRCTKTAEKKRISIKRPYVIDAGFNPFIAQHLKQLKKSALIFSYPLPTRQRAVKLKAKSLPCPKVERHLQSLLTRHQSLQRINTEWQQCVIIKPDNWFFAQLFPPIYLAYNHLNALKLYAGRSNMSDNQGKYRDIAIFYDETKAE